LTKCRRAVLSCSKDLPTASASPSPSGQPRGGPDRINQLGPKLPPLWTATARRRRHVEFAGRRCHLLRLQDQDARLRQAPGRRGEASERPLRLRIVSVGAKATVRTTATPSVQASGRPAASSAADPAPNRTVGSRCGRITGRFKKDEENTIAFTISGVATSSETSRSATSFCFISG